MILLLFVMQDFYLAKCFYSVLLLLLLKGYNYYFLLYINECCKTCDKLVNLIHFPNNSNIFQVSEYIGNCSVGSAGRLSTICPS